MRRPWPGIAPPDARCFAISASGISRNRMTWYGKKNVEAMASMNTGRLPSIERRLVHRSPASSALGSSYRSHMSGCSLAVWMQTLRITSPCWRPGAPCVTGPMVPSRSGTTGQPP